MTDGRYSALDEVDLRKLLEGTTDLDERRLIRSAIHELRRKEIQGMEEALATKRFRSENASELLENKENHLRSRRQQEDSQQGSLEILSGKLESITDIDQLTALLRRTSDYEERKLIRAAIRSLRDQELDAFLGKFAGSSKETKKEKATLIQTRSSAELPDSNQVKQPRRLAQNSRDLQGVEGDGVRIQELRNQRESQRSRAAAKDMASGMVLVLDETPDAPLLQCVQPEGTDHGSTDSDLESESGKESCTESQRDAEGKSWRSVSEEGNHESSSGVEDEDEETEHENGFKQGTADCDRGSGTNIAGPRLNHIPSITDDGEKKSGMREDQTPRSRTPVSRDKSYFGLAGRSLQGPPHSFRPEGCDHSPASLLSSLTHLPRHCDRKGKTGESRVDGLSFSRNNSVKDRVKKFMEDSPSQAIEFGTSFSPLKRAGALRTPRILQFQQSPSGSHDFRAKVASPLSNGEMGSPTPTSEHASRRKQGDTNNRLADSTRKKDNDTNLGLTGEVLAGHLGCKEQKPFSTPLGLTLAGRLATPENSTPERSYSRQRKDSAAEVSKDTWPLNSALKSLSPDCLENPTDALGRQRTASEEDGGTKQTHTNRAVGDEQKFSSCGRSNIVQSEQNGLAVLKEQNSHGAEILNHSEQPSLDISTTPSGQQRLLESKYTRDSKDLKLSGAELKPTDTDMKTLLTIEIKDGRTPNVSSRITGTPSSQKAELNFGLRPTHFKIAGSSSSALTMETESVVASEQPVQREEQLNGLKETQSTTAEKGSKLTQEELNAIEDLEVLDKLLDQAQDFEERKLIRAAMRELRTRKRDQREKEREMRLQEMKQKTQEEKMAKGGCAAVTVTSKTEKSADGLSSSSFTKTQKIAQSDDRSKTSRMMTVESSYVKRSETSATYIQTKSSFSSSSTSSISSSNTPSKKVGSIFDREDDSASRSSSLAALERKQAEKKKEMMRSQSLPKTSAAQARKAMIEKLEKEGGSPIPAVARVKVQRSSSFGVPNANSIKQMLLDWCRAKTRGYENVDIQNFSSSWSDGMAFCALVHSFFPEAYDFSQLAPQNRRQNFELAFAAAEKHADCPQLLDTDDMVRMREPDWKCVYTYIQEFYRCLVQKGLVKTKNS